MRSRQIINLADGDSGGGKSTTVRLIERLYDPDEGTVLLDNEDVRNYDHKSLHRALAIVAQEPTLYARCVPVCMCVNI
jgi:ABC-type multidrug transport system fused ATPase/permease subunit